MIVVRAETSAAMEELGRRVARIARAGDIVTLTGPLGAGKTTFARGVGEELGVRGPVQSPTFVLARTHPSLVGGPELVHVDAYRLGDPRELDDLDLDFAASVTLVEWGRDAVAHVSREWLDIEIQRPTAGGAGAAGVAGAADSAASAAAAGAADSNQGDADADADADADELDEPRTVTLRPVGPRWTTPEALAALAALAAPTR